jgi:GNAT superfamily N-acetyltransferase
MPSDTRAHQLTIVPLDPADAAAVEGAYQVDVATIANDVPDFPVPSRQRFEASLRVPWPGEDASHWIARTDSGEVVGALVVELPTLDNLENGWIKASVLPAHRRRGIGRALYDHGVAFARERGRRRLMAFTPFTLPAGGDPRDPGPTAFAGAVGMRSALEEIRRRLDLSTVDWALLDRILADARARAGGYSLVRWRNIVPDEHVAGVAMLDSDFLNEAPLGDLVLEAQKIDVTRVRAVEEARGHYGRTVIATAAVHDATGQVVALSDLGREAGHVEHAGQGITLVHPAHRGHRLGLLTKIENLRYAVAELPGLRYIDTWNAAVNAHMIAINEEMGFRPVDAWHNWQCDI